MSWRVAFLISAALNVLIIGAVAGFVLGGGLTRVRNAGAMAMGEPRAVIAALPGDVRAELRGDLVRAWFNSDAERVALRAANADVLRQIETEPYDPAAMQAALRRQREAGVIVVGAFQDQVAHSLTRLTPAQRQATAAALMRVRGRAQGAPALDDGALAPSETMGPTETPRERLRERLRERRNGG